MMYKLEMRPRRLLRLLTLSVAAGAVFMACDERTVGLRPSIAVIYGSATDTSGAPVGDALVSIYAVPLDRCGASTKGALVATSRTNEGGLYRAVGHFIHVSRETMCLAVHASSPAGLGLRDTTIVGDTVTFIHESLTPPVDSVRVDIVFPGS